MANAREGSGSTIKKNVDESWKQSVEKEKEAFSQSGEPAVQPDPSFTFLISSLGMQALLSLGELPGAESPEKPDFIQAQYLIDTLQMLSVKTKGNLSAEEGQALENLLYELRMKFVEKQKS